MATTVRYDSVITAIGEEAPPFFSEGIAVLFSEDAPEELHDISIVHRPTVTDGGIQPGDRIVLGDETITVTAVGPVANDNLVNLGHFVVKRNGNTEHSQPGDVCCDVGEIPHVEPGDVFRIEGDA